MGIEQRLNRNNEEVQQLGIDFSGQTKKEIAEEIKKPKSLEELIKEKVDEINHKYPYAAVPEYLVKLDDKGNFTFKGEKDLEEYAINQNQIYEPSPRDTWQNK